VIVKWILARLLGNLFGEGFAADLAGRGVVYLADEARGALRKDEERVTLARLRPGETYTVIARPRPTRRERRLAASQRSVERRFEKVTRPNRAQLRAARRLARTQARLERAREGTRRHARLVRKEQRRGDRFDLLMRPSRRELRLARELTELTAELDRERERNFQRARGSRRRRPQVRVHD